MLSKTVRHLASATVALALSLAAAAPATAALAKLTPQSDYGLIAVEVTPVEGLAPGRAYSLNIARYSREEGRFTQNSFSGWAQFDKLGKEAGKTYYLRKTKPGTYGLLSVSLSAWGTCFDGGSVVFDVQPGKVTFIGRYDASQNLGEVTDAVRTGVLPRVTGANALEYIFGVSRPSLTPPGEMADWNTGFGEWLKTAEPGVTGEVVAADLTPITFNTGTDAFGIQRICGGYYAKPKVPAASSPAQPAAPTTP